MLRKPEPDLRSRWPYRHTVPANTTLAHLVVAVDVMITRNYIGGFTWHVPRQRPDQDDTNYCGRCNQHKTTTEAPSRHQSVRLDSCYHCYVDRRQIPNHGITYCHVCHTLLLCFVLKNKKTKLGYLYWECRAGLVGLVLLWSWDYEKWRWLDRPGFIELIFIFGLLGFSFEGKVEVFISYLSSTRGFLTVQRGYATCTQWWELITSSRGWYTTSLCTRE